MASDPQRTLQQEIDAAHQDPLIQQRLGDFMRDLDEDHGNANDPNHPGWPYHRKEADDLAVLYAVRYPRAGLDWIFGFNDPRFHRQNLLVRFVMELQESRPGMAMRLLEQMDSSERKGKFAGILAHHARAEDIDPLWKYLLDPANQIGIESELNKIKRRLIGAEAGIDPDAAWERYLELPGAGDERDFIENFGQLRPETPFPVRFLDRILANGHDVSQSVESAIWRCESPANIAPIEAWLAQGHAGFDPKPAFNEMGKWWLGRQKDPATSELWYARAK